jgi:thioredoxin reductase/ferredoxin
MTVHYEVDGSLVLQTPVELPDVLDVLVVGGGPAGTATAFRARELGLSALVIDFDDLMKRIRDYSKDKLILPSFGGGDKMKFPAGGDLIRKLHFTDIDKDEICERWKGYYRDFGIPAKIGVELTGLERGSDGVWTAAAWNHRVGKAETIRALHVVLALGRGVPRRFDIPGNTDGVAYRMDDPANYVGEPVCVMGGGTSAAEAVIAISNAKIEADDNCLVYWSYRGSKMPRVSKALADVFFSAYVGNGNIRYQPHSEPVAVVTGPDREEYLSVRVDRRSVDGRAKEAAHLEFPKTRCIACIGEDIPEAFLREIGTPMVVGPKDKKMMAVTPLLETCQPNVYLLGDLLSQAYLETQDLQADPAGFQLVKHRGNIKSALRDGVFIADVIKKKLEGEQNIEVVIREAEDPTADRAGDVRVTPEEPSGPPPESLAEDRRPVESAYLVRTTPAGVDEDEFSLDPSGLTTIGREGCVLDFPDDGLIDAHHASILRTEKGYVIRDDGSRAGTFLRLRAGRPVEIGDKGLFRVGRQILVVRTDGDVPTVLHYDSGGALRGKHSLAEGTLVFGRSGGKNDPDVSLDPEDLTLSRFQMSFTSHDGRVRAEDFNSRNGTYLKVTGPRPIEHDDVFRVGGLMFRLNLEEEAALKTGSMPLVARAAPSAPDVAAAPAEAPTGAQVTFAGQDVTVPVAAGETILDVADANDVDMDYECWCGMCGCDVIRVVEGREHLNEIDPKELKTLERKGADTSTCRLACMTKATGPVVVEVVE